MTDNVRPFTLVNSGKAEPQRSGTLYCTGCGSRAFRLTVDADDAPLSIECHNCEDVMNIRWAHEKDPDVDQGT